MTDDILNELDPPFIKICKIARDKLQELAKSIINNEVGTSLAEIENYWKFYRA